MGDNKNCFLALDIPYSLDQRTFETGISDARFK
jgi:hypothetical protein